MIRSKPVSSMMRTSLYISGVTGGEECAAGTAMPRRAFISCSKWSRTTVVSWED